MKYNIQSSQVIWLKNEKPIKESPDIQLLFEGDRCTLIIREAIPNDSGSFKCVAQNPYGAAESLCKLHVEREWRLKEIMLNDMRATWEVEGEIF